ncbi:MAG TPA: ABC transporter ATP-binding protein, partial [Micromonosporaceae bacterium]
PLARRDFLRGIGDVVAEHGVSVVLSSHLVADLERVCDFVIVLVASRVRVAGPIEDLLATHHRLVGPRDRTVAGVEVIEARHAEDRSTLLVRSERPIDPALTIDPIWTVAPVSLEDIVLAYMGTEVQS